MDGVKWNVRVFAEGWMEWNEMDMDPYVGPYVDLRVMDWNPVGATRTLSLLTMPLIIPLCPGAIIITLCGLEYIC